MDFVSRFESAAVSALGAFPPGAVFLAAVSGGADSSAMLCALACVSRPVFSLRCIHVEHGVRPPEESRGDAAAVKRLCGKLGVPCRVAALPPGKIASCAGKRGMGLEAAARLYRHRILRREARRTGAAAVLIAHTRDDLLETVLMRCFRGSGPRGLAAMPQRTAGPIPVVRPLLLLSRADVLKYLELKKIPFRTDSTNQDDRFLRNKIRNRLVPVLEGLFPYWARGIESLGATQSLAASFIEAEAEKRVVWEAAGQGLRTDAASFFAQPPIIREEALFQGIDRRRALFSARRAGVRRFCAGGRTAVDLGSFAGPGKILRVREEGGFVILSRAEEEGEEGFSLLIKEPGLYILKGILIEVKEPGQASGLDKREGLF
ncbi:MAG: tRNA lysidine(34) synthetase TilS, partial [Treponema sp.]|nr:tRNA lysidine(34) synthetase TilS [Treponema sp.]